jgi:hypothetical protein
MATISKKIKERFQKIETSNKIFFTVLLVSFIATAITKYLGVSILPGAPLLIDGMFISLFFCVYLTLFTITFGHGVAQLCLRIRNRLFSF